jgi:hypothetical protein
LYEHIQRTTRPRAARSKEINMTTASKTNTKPALLKALADVAGAPSFNVPRDEVLPQVFAILGIDPADLGTDARGRSKAGRLLNACFSELKKEGLVASPLRNQYALTDSGWAQATGNPVVELSNPVVSEAAPTPSAPAPVRVATKAPVSGSSVAFRQGATHSDPYILSLQIAKSPCFGVAYSSRAKTCAGCPVAALCQSARTARLSDLAAQLQRMAASTGSVEVAPSTPEAVLEALDNAILVPIDHEIDCDHCSTTIKVGSEGILVPDAGMFHQECAATALAA